MEEKELKKLLRNNKDKVGRMLNGRLSKVLSTHKLVYRGDKSQIGSKVFVVINREAIDKLKNIGYQIDNNYENKKAPTFAEVEAEENLENLIDNNIIPQNTKKDSYKKKENKVIHNKFNDGTNNTFTNYEADELEKLLKENQDRKFNPNYKI